MIKLRYTVDRKTPVSKFLCRVREEKRRIDIDCKMESPLGFWGSEAEEVLIQRFPLHKACRDGDPARLSCLVAQSTQEQLVAEDQFYSWTPIHWAAYFGKVCFVINFT